MIGHLFDRFWIWELRETKKSHNFLDSWIKPIFFHQDRFLKLFDPRIWSVLLSRDSQGSTSNPYFMIKGVVLLVVVVLISRINNRKMVEIKNLYLMGLIPIPMNSIGPRNETLEESFRSSNINRLIVSLLHLPKGKKISESSFMDPQESTWVLPINQKCIMPESNRGSRWWRNQIGKKRDSSCQISNETVAGIEISFKEKDSKSMEFLFLSYMDDPIGKDHDWKLFDRLSPRKKQNIINLNWGQLFEILGKDLLMSAFYEKGPIEGEGFLKQQGALDNVWLVNQDPFFSKVRNVSSNIQYDSTRSIFADFRQWKGSSYQSRDHFDSIRNEDSEYHKWIDQTEIPFLSDKWSELHLGWNPTERSTRDQKFWKKKEQDVSLVPFRQSENQEMVAIFKIIRYFQNTVSIHPISSDPGCYMVPKDEPDIDNKISFLNQNPFGGLFHLFHDRNKGEYTLGHDLESEERFQEMANRFTLSITQPDVVYHRGFALSIDAYGLYQKKFLNGARDESKKKSLFLLTPLFYEENESFYRRLRKKLVRIHCGNDLEDPKRERVLFASNKIMETVNQYRLIRNRIQIQYRACGYIRNGSNRFFLMVREKIGNETLNHITLMKYRINQHLWNWNLKKSQKKWFDPLISRTERSMNWDPDEYIYEWSNGIKNFQEHLDPFVSEQKNPFQAVFDRLCIRINQYWIEYWIDWSEIFDIKEENWLKKDWFKPLRFFLSILFKALRFFLSILSKVLYKQFIRFLIPWYKFWFWVDLPKLFDIKEENWLKKDWFRPLRFLVSESLPLLGKSLLFLSKSKLLHFFFVSIGTIHRSEIRIYEWQSDQPRNPLLGLLGLQFLPLKKLKPFLLDDPDTSQRPKFLINGGRILPFLFNKIPKWMLDSFHTRKNRRKSFANTDSYFSMLSQDRDNWLNPVKPFHRSSLISSFYKANRLRFLNNPRHFWLYCNKRFPFYVEKTRMKNSDLTYGQFLNILFIRNKRFSLCRETISPIDLQVSDIFIPKDFPQSVDERYNLYKSFQFPIRFEPFVRRAIYSIADISATPLTEEQIVNLERTYCQPFSDMNGSADSEGKNLDQYLSFNSNMGLIHTPWSEKDLPSVKSKKPSPMDISLQGDLSKWNRFLRSIPYFFTSTGSKYLKPMFFDTFSNPMPILESYSPQFVSILDDIMEKSDLLWITLEDEFDEKLWPILFQWKIRLSAIWIKCIQNFLLPGEVEIIDRNHESSVLSCLISTNACEFLILFFLLVAGYFVPRCLLFVSRASSELQTELEKIKPFTIESYISELEELVAEYSKLHYLPFKDLLLFPLQEFEDSLREIRRLAFAMILGRGPSFWVKAIRFSLRRRYWNLINFISLIPNPIHPIAFWIKTRHLSRTSKELHLLIRKGERGNSDCIAEKIESWAENSHAVENQDKPFLIQFANLTTEKRIDQILLSLTYSDPLSNSDAGYHEEPGFFYLRSIVDIHKKDLMNYEFNRFSLAEKRIFLAHYQTITYSQTSHGSDSTLFPSHGEPFSFRVDISPSRGILLLGSRGTGRSYLVKYLATNSYVPFITVFPFLGGDWFFSWGSLGATFLLGAKNNPGQPSHIGCANSDDLPTDNEIHAINKIHAINEIHAINKIHAINEIHAILGAKNNPGQPSHIGCANSDDLPTDNEIHAINKIHAINEIHAINKIHAINEIHAINKAIAIGLRSVTAVLTLFNKYRGPIQSDVITNLQLAKAMSPCIIWIPSIHDLNVHESNYFKLGLLVNYLSKDWESARKILVIASTHIPKKLDPALLATDKLNTCIKVRRPLIPQQRRHFCIVSYTRGVDLEGQICHTNGFGSITVGSNARDLAAFSNQALSLTIGHKKSIMETKTIELVLHRQIWDSRADLGSLKNHGIAFYQIGRAVAQNLLISNCPLDLLSSYVQKRTSIDTDFYLYRWYFELETSMKKFTILLYLLSCSAGSVAQDLWSALGDEKDWIASYRFVETDSDVVHGLLEVEGALVGSSRTEKDCSQFDNNRVTLLLRSEARNPLDMMQNGFDSILDHNEKNKWEEWGVSPETKEERERLVDNRIVWAPRLWRPCGNLFDCIEMSNELGFPYPFRGAYRFGGKLSHEEDQFPYESPYEPDDELEDEFPYEPDDELEENDSEFTAKARDRFFQEENFLVINRFIWDPPDAFFSLFEDGPAFSRREFFADEEMLRVLPFKTASPRVNLQSFFSKNKKEKHFELLIHRQRRINSSLTNSSLYKGSFRSNILSASYHYLSNLFLSKGRLLDQLTKTLLRKRWLFLDEMKDLLHERGERFPIP
nr:hypothetical protein RF2 [Echinodorus cordifolius]